MGVRFLPLAPLGFKMKRFFRWTIANWFILVLGFAILLALRADISECFSALSEISTTLYRFAFGEEKAVPNPMIGAPL